MEMEKVKRLTLDINERLEEEDYQDMLASVSSNLSKRRPIQLKLLVQSFVIVLISVATACYC